MIDPSRSASEDTWAADAEDAEEGPTDPHSVDATLASESGTQPSSPTVRHGTFEAGSLVGRYVILAKLGAGGMGVVYAAYDPELDRKVALKLLLPSRDGSAGQARARLLREAQALAKLAHPNVVGIHDVGTIGDRVWIAMEYVDGQTLGRWSKARTRSWREVLDVMSKVGSGVAAAHAAGLLHRDLKPDNVMVGSDGRVCVMDFGLARRHDEDLPTIEETNDRRSVLSMQLTHSGALLGTPAYMAPEQFQSKPATSSSDQFSFCVTFWEALYGKRPFTGGSVAELMANVLDSKIVPPPRGVQVPRWLHTVLTTGLARDPSQRFASIEALLGTLARGESRVRMRRASAVLGLLALGVASIYPAKWYDEQRRIHACEAEGAQIDEVWNAESREALRAGLVATKLPYAPTVADKSMPWIDAQADAWRDAATQACMNASVHATWNVTTLDKSEFCLEERRIELATFVHELSRADATVVLRAVQAAASLSPIATCIDEPSLAAMPDPPDEGLRARVAEIRTDLSRARYLESAGKVADGLDLAKSVRMRAEALAWPPLSAAALVLEAEMLGAAGNYAEAESTGVAAYLAAERARSWDQAASAGFQLVAAIGRQGRGDEARVWIELATVAQEFAGDPLELREGERLLMLGNLDNHAKQYDRAAESFERARAIFERALGPDHPRVALALSNLANTHWGKGELDEALELYGRALVIRARALGPNHPDVAKILFNQGVMYDEKGERQRARELYERAFALEEAALGPDHPDLAPALINLGNALQRQGEFAASKPYYERALRLVETALGPDHIEVALVLDNLGIAHEELGELDEAKQLYLRALSIRERALPAGDPLLAASQRNLAEVQLLAGDYEQARLGFERTIALLQAIHGQDDLEIAKPTARLGETLAKLGRYEEALALLERALAIRTTGGAPPDLLAESQFMLAAVLWDAPESAGGDRPRARSLAEQARDQYRGLEGWEFELGEVEAWLASHSF